MARPTKKGLDYFPLDVDFLSDLKVRRIIKACGKEAVHILLALLANVYRDEGYYVLWDEDLAFLVADEVGAKEGTVEELVKKAVQVKFFDKDIFDKYSVLTSKGIQNRYILATKERKKVELEFKYLLTNEVNRSNISINGRNNSVNQGNNQQSKVKESKGKEIKEDATASEYTINQPSMLAKINNDSTGFGGRLKKIDEYAWTITTKQLRCPNSGIVDIGNGKFRLLTPKECWLLQGYDVQDYEKASKVNGKTALYKQAGNSIPVGIFESLFEVLI